MSVKYFNIHPKYDFLDFISSRLSPYIGPKFKKIEKNWKKHKNHIKVQFWDILNSEENSSNSPYLWFFLIFPLKNFKTQKYLGIRPTYIR